MARARAKANNEADWQSAASEFHLKVNDPDFASDAESRISTEDRKH